MSFEGWLIKVNEVEFPTSLIAYGTYKSTPNQITDLDSYTDDTGELHRNILPHRSSKVEFNTKPMWLPDKMLIQQLLPVRTEMAVRYWNDETNSYESGKFYVPDITYEINRVDRERRTIHYNPIRIAFIEY